MCLLSFSNVGATDYREVWGREYRQAEVFIQGHEVAFEHLTGLFGVDARQAMAVVFPELLRYSLLKDFFETEAVEWGYVNFGLGYGDFSIGQFQMKPSFIEDLEEIVCRDDRFQMFLPLFSYDAISEKEIRQERVVRLQQVGYQIKYLSCFITLARAVYPALASLTPVETIEFLAVMYNAGLGKSIDTYKALARRPSFPYGAGYTGKQYCYAAIAKDYYLTITKHNEGK